MKKRIYLDNAATTAVDPRVIDVMLPFMNECYGNASSLHSFGTEASDVLNSYRKSLAKFIGGKACEIIFTSSGTESNNLALKGIAYAHASKGKHIIVSSIEHDCVLNAALWLESQGYAITFLPVNEYGLVQPETLKKYIRKDTILVSVMHANNEIGTVQPLKDIGKICHENNILFHTDACQSFGKIEIDVEDMNIDLLTLNSHKIHGPKGVGALYVREGLRLSPQLHGGGQESGMRSSTENIAGIAGFVKAAELCFQNRVEEMTTITQMRDVIIKNLLNKYDNAYLNGHSVERLPGNVNIAFHGLEGETIRLLLLLDEAGIAVSAGSACSSNGSGGHASHVLQAIGRDPFEARGAVRISLSRFNTKEDVEIFLQILDEKIGMLNPIFS